MLFVHMTHSSPVAARVVVCTVVYNLLMPPVVLADSICECSHVQ
jgi:hypothetical protein